MKIARFDFKLNPVFCSILFFDCLFVVVKLSCVAGGPCDLRAVHGAGAAAAARRGGALPLLQDRALYRCPPYHTVPLVMAHNIP